MSRREESVWAQVECGDSECAWSGFISELAPLHDDVNPEGVGPNETIPVGSCPVCESFAWPKQFANARSPASSPPPRSKAHRWVEARMRAAPNRHELHEIGRRLAQLVTREQLETQFRVEMHREGYFQEELPL